MPLENQILHIIFSISIKGSSLGKRSSHKYIGKAGSPAFLKAVEMVARRAQIEGLQQALHTLELGLLDLVEEATRVQQKSSRQ